MVANGITTCSTGKGPQKTKKNWREVCEYLHSRVDRTRILRKVGCVLEVNMAALEQVKRREALASDSNKGLL